VGAATSALDGESEHLIQLALRRRVGMPPEPLTA
jgi:ABC-type multidrug transport system fused ATPase/permease subunit